MDDWKEQLQSVAIGLLTLEVNTIRKCGMSAQKMPDVPIALHSIVDCYSEYLRQRGYGVTETLQTCAINRISPPDPPPAPEGWFEKLMTWEPGGAAMMRSVDLTNGAASFEALRWAAEAALRLDDEIRQGARKGQPFTEEDRAVIARVKANCRQLTTVVLSLQKTYLHTYPKPADLTPDSPVMIDGTLEQTARACFDGVQTLPIPLNAAVLVRKVWDIGTETVLAQTSVQVDGDVVTRISPTMLEAQREFLLTLHNSSVQTGLGQWKALFDLVAELINGLAARLFKSV